VADPRHGRRPRLGRGALRRGGGGEPREPEVAPERRADATDQGPDAAPGGGTREVGVDVAETALEMMGGGCRRHPVVGLGLRRGEAAGGEEAREQDEPDRQTSSDGGEEWRHLNLPTGSAATEPGDGRAARFYNRVYMTAFNGSPAPCPAGTSRSPAGG